MPPVTPDPAPGEGSGAPGMRRPLTVRVQPSVLHGPSQVTRPGSLTASVTCPALQVPATFTRPRWFGTLPNGSHTRPVMEVTRDRFPLGEPSSMSDVVQPAPAAVGPEQPAVGIFRCTPQVPELAFRRLRGLEPPLGRTWTVRRAHGHAALVGMCRMSFAAPHSQRHERFRWPRTRVHRCSLPLSQLTQVSRHGSRSLA